MRAWFAFLWLLATAAIAGAAAWFAYGAGVATHVATASGGAVAPYPYWGYGGWGFGFPIFGFFWFLFVLFVLLVVFRGIFGFRRGWGPGYRRFGYGPGGGMHPAMEERLREWHRQAHGETETKTPQT